MSHSVFDCGLRPPLRMTLRFALIYTDVFTAGASHPPYNSGGPRPYPNPVTSTENTSAQKQKEMPWHLFFKTVFFKRGTRYEATVIHSLINHQSNLNLDCVTAFGGVEAFLHHAKDTADLCVFDKLLLLTVDGTDEVAIKIMHVGRGKSFNPTAKYF